MGEERTSIIGKAASLKKAGVPTAVTVAILVLSTPGFYEFFLDGTDDEAMAKAEVAYEVLTERSNAQSREVDRLRDEVRELRMFLMGGSFYPMEGATEDDSEESLSSKGVSVGIGKPAGMMSPEELFDSGMGIQVQQQEQNVALPESLNDRSLADRIQKKVSKR